MNATSRVTAVVIVVVIGLSGCSSPNSVGSRDNSWGGGSSHTSGPNIGPTEGGGVVVNGGDARGSIPAVLVGEWDGTPSNGAVDSYTFTVDGQFTSVGQTANGGTSCRGVAVASGAILHLSSSNCGWNRATSFVIDGNVLKLDRSSYIRGHITPNTAACLLGPWHFNGGRLELAGAPWELSESVVLENLPDPAAGGSEYLHFGADGAASDRTASMVWYAPGITMHLRMVATISWTASYRVSGSTISYSNANGSHRFVFQRDGQTTTDDSGASNLSPDQFECNSTTLTLSGSFYELTYWRG